MKSVSKCLFLICAWEFPLWMWESCECWRFDTQTSATDLANPNTATHRTLHANDVIQNTAYAANNHACRLIVHNQADSASRCMWARRKHGTTHLRVFPALMLKAHVCLWWACCFNEGVVSFTDGNFFVFVFSRANRDLFEWCIRSAVSKTPHLFLILSKPLKLKTGNAGGGEKKKMKKKKNWQMDLPFLQMFTIFFFTGEGTSLIVCLIKVSSSSDGACGCAQDSNVGCFILSTSWF